MVHSPSYTDFSQMQQPGILTGECRLFISTVTVYIFGGGRGTISFYQMKIVRSSIHYDAVLSWIFNITKNSNNTLNYIKLSECLKVLDFPGQDSAINYKSFYITLLISFPRLGFSRSLTEFTKLDKKVYCRQKKNPILFID